MKIKVCKEYVLVRPVVAENKTASGIILPEKGKEVPQRAFIVSMYLDENVLDRPQYKEGDLIIYKKWEGWDFKPDGATGPLYRFIKREDVLGIIEEKGGKKHV